jgi:hypothetical protein
LMICTGRVRNTVKAALAKLAEQRLAVGGDAGWVRGPRTLDEVADTLGADELAAERRAKHLRERRQLRSVNPPESQAANLT